ncbi:hypothetical protein [Reichenbachiella sp.]|uniref:hypothetical protein n=1 Tax=Reichenbachiella sp. TaxID=2184521 RepID=UPI003298523D
MNRKKFIKKGIISSLGITLLPHTLFAKAMDQATALDHELVYEFVKVAHGDFEEVNNLLTKTPTLLNASHDWGNGDFETALGAASHMGNREIAMYLIEKGARYNLFTAAMLGDLLTVKETLTKYPTMVTAKGPHDLDMIHHAKAGGEQSKDVLAYLQNFTTSKKERMPDRKDLVFATTPYEALAVKLVDFFHGEGGKTKEEFITAYFSSKQKGEEFFDLVLDRIEPPASIVELEGKTHEECRLILTKTDNSTNYYFKMAFTSKEPHQITKIMASGSRKVLEVPFTSE